MTVCTVCQSVEPKIVEYELEGELFDGCGECGTQEDSLQYYDEDLGKSRDE